MDHRRRAATCRIAQSHSSRRPPARRSPRTRSIRAAKHLLVRLLHRQSAGALTGRTAFPSHGRRSRNRLLAQVNVALSRVLLSHAKQHFRSSSETAVPLDGPRASVRRSARAYGDRLRLFGGRASASFGAGLRTWFCRVGGRHLRLINRMVEQDRGQRESAASDAPDPVVALLPSRDLSTLTRCRVTAATDEPLASRRDRDSCFRLAGAEARAEPSHAVEGRPLRRLGTAGTGCSQPGRERKRRPSGA